MAERRPGIACLVAGLAALSGCGDSATGNTRLLELGSECFRVPVASLVYFNAKSKRSATLQFANQRIHEGVPGYVVPRALPNGVRDTLSVSLFMPTEAEAAQIRANEQKSRDRTFYNLWYALEEFETRTVEPIAGTSLYRVRPLADGPTWMVVTRIPDPATRDAHSAQDFWIATCFEIDEGRLDRCTANLEENGLRMTMYTIEANLSRREALAQFVVESMGQWKTACASSG